MRVSGPRLFPFRLCRIRFFVLVVFCILPFILKLLYVKHAGYPLKAEFEVFLKFNLVHGRLFKNVIISHKQTKFERSRCCPKNHHNGNSNIDMCNRSDCLWPCPNVKNSKYEKFNVTENQAFFLETSGSAFLNFRQACAIESFIYRNPNLTAHLLMFGQNTDLKFKTMKTLVQYYPSLQITRINIEDYLVDTPLELWYYCSNWKNSSFAVVHLSDAIRLLSLSKYGGYYFDLDIIHLRPVTSYRNFVVDETHGLFCNSVIHADHNHRQIMKNSVEEFATTYR